MAGRILSEAEQKTNKPNLDDSLTEGLKLRLLKLHRDRPVALWHWRAIGLSRLSLITSVPLSYWPVTNSHDKTTLKTGCNVAWPNATITNDCHVTKCARHVTRCASHVTYYARHDWSFRELCLANEQRSRQ